MGKVARIYADTSVFGGVLDALFRDDSLRFFELVDDGKCQLVVSEVVRREITRAPMAVRALFDVMVKSAEFTWLSADAIRLAQAYQMAGIVAPRWSEDALHIALATVADCDAIISWNFKHIVNSRQISMYNGLNKLLGYNPIRISSPAEVADDDEENK